MNECLLISNEELKAVPNEMEKQFRAISYYDQFLGFSPKASLQRAKDDLHTQILSNSIISRQVCLLNMCLMPDFHFFENESLEEMQAFINAKPEKVLTHIQPRLAQALSMLILSVHSNINTFVGLITEYFEKDSTLTLVFSYSTFPAVFNYFSLDYFCKLGSEMLIPLIGNPKLTVLTNSMVFSYFFCHHAFFDALWNKYFNLYSPDKSRREMINVLFFSLESTVCFLTKYHIKVIKSASLIDEEGAQSLFIENVLMPSLKVLGNCESYQYPKNGIFALMEYLSTLSKNDSKHLIKIVKDAKVLYRAIPSMPSFDDLSRIPFVISDRDVFTLVELVGNTDVSLDFSQLIVELRTTYHKGYSPFYLELQSPLYTQKAARENENEADEIALNILKRYANNLGVSYLSMIPGTPLYSNLPYKISQKCKTIEFASFAMEKQISIYENRNIQIENIISISEMILKLESIKEIIEFKKSILMRGLASILFDSLIQPVMKKKYVQSKKKLKCIDLVLNCTLNNSTKTYDYLILLLNSTKMPPNNKLVKLKPAFIKVLNKCERTEYSIQPVILKYALIVADMVKNAQNELYGSNALLLLYILDFIEAQSADQDILFQIIMSKSHFARAFDVMIMLFDLFFMNSSFKNRVPKDKLVQLELLLKRFLHLLKLDPKLYFKFIQYTTIDNHKVI